MYKFNVWIWSHRVSKSWELKLKKEFLDLKHMGEKKKKHMGELAFWKEPMTSKKYGWGKKFVCIDPFFMIEVYCYGKVNVHY